MFPTFGMEILERKFLILQLSSESISIRNEERRSSARMNPLKDKQSM